MNLIHQIWCLNNLHLYTDLKIKDEYLQSRSSMKRILLAQLLRAVMARPYCLHGLPLKEYV